VREYWIIDPLQRRAEFYRLTEGQYNLARSSRIGFFVPRSSKVSGSTSSGYSPKTPK
jgi:Uma2 family endonuclease